MVHKSLFGLLLDLTYIASGSKEPIERYFASMFAGYYDQTDSQPSCAAVKAIARGDRTAPRKLLHHYRDPDQPHCPKKLMKDLSVLAECCFADTSRREKLYHTLEAFLQTIPAADAEDLCHRIPSGDLIHMWSCVTWYALCGDHYG